MTTGTDTKAGAILLLEGDGIGPEVLAAARRMLDWLSARCGFTFDVRTALAGGAALEAEGQPLSDATFAQAAAADAILLGAVGGPCWDHLGVDQRPETALRRLRVGLTLYANLRPVSVADPLLDLSPLKPERVRGTDLLVVRELTGGLYVGRPRGIAERADGETEGVDTQRYSSSEIRRVAAIAFDLARQRRGLVCSVDKANALFSSQHWRAEVTRLHRERYADVRLEHMYVDTCAMQLVRDPARFDVLLTDNMFGDILSDEASMLPGSLGMLPSASLGPPGANGRPAALYEPAHGSAPDIAGRGIANPIAAILSVALMLRFSFQAPAEADRIEAAVRAALASGLRTPDLAQPGETVCGTAALTDAILAALEAPTTTTPNTDHR